MAGDKAYDSEPLRKDLRRRGSEPIIAHRQRRDGTYPPSAQGFDKETYRRRNVVERLIGNVKEFRRIATRYDKLAANFKSFIPIGFTRLWLKHLLSSTA